MGSIIFWFVVLVQGHGFGLGLQENIMLHILFLEVNLHISLTNHYLPISSEVLLQVILQLYIFSLLPIV
jgi:hypothetical protein